MSKEVKKLEEVTHGLIAIDPTTAKDGKVDILHFCGYWSEPSKSDAKHLLEELSTDEEFGLTEIAHRLQILPAPQEIIDAFCKTKQG